jgi:hypothetical protein
LWEREHLEDLGVDWKTVLNDLKNRLGQRGLY